MKKVEGMVKLLLSQKSIEKWGMKIDQTPLSITNSVLGNPQFVSRKQVIYCDENAFRKAIIDKPVDLTHEDWILFYQHPKKGRGRSNYDAADKVLTNFKDACSRLGVKVEDPHFVELENEGDTAEIEQALLNFMM